MANLGKNDFQDPYIDQSSGCLRNLLDIKDSEKLSKAEISLALHRLYDLDNGYFFRDEPVDKRFDFQHLKDIHKYLFQDVYEWAGQIREVNLSNGETHFLHHSLIEQGAESTFIQLKQQNYLEGLDANTFSENAAYYLTDINHIHPFREGNGRAQREFINQLAHHNDYHIQWENVNQKQMIEASIESDRGNVKPLATLIHENLSHREIAFFIKHMQEDGRDYKIFSPETGKKYHGQIIHVTERYVLQGSINSPSQVLSHNRHSLSRTPHMNEIVEISYPHGDIGLVGRPEMFKAKDFKTYILEKNSQQHEWER